MRSFSLVTNLLALVICGSATGADVEVETRNTNCQPPGLRLTIEASRAYLEPGRTYDSPLYEGLTPTTIEMFQASDRIIPREFEVSLPRLPISHPKIENPQLVPPDVRLRLWR